MSKNKTTPLKKGKKYDFRVFKTNETWNAEIIRRVTSVKTVVSKKQSNFKKEVDATAWAEQEIVLFLQKQSERNKRHAEQRS